MVVVLTPSIGETMKRSFIIVIFMMLFFSLQSIVMAQELKLDYLIDEITKQIRTLHEKAKDKPDYLQYLTSYDLEIAFVIKKEISGDAKGEANIVKYVAIAAGIAGNYSKETTHRITLHFSLPPNYIIGKLDKKSKDTTSRHVFCAPARVPFNPAPTYTKSTSAASSGENYLVKIADRFDLGESNTKNVELDNDKSYWFAASGCPRMGNIKIEIIDSDGKTLAYDERYSPALCFHPLKSGNYTLKITAVTTMNSSSWGNIDSCFSESSCHEED